MPDGLDAPAGQKFTHGRTVNVTEERVEMSQEGHVSSSSANVSTGVRV